MGSVMGALGEGCHVDEGRHYWKKCEHGCNGRRNGVQLSVLVGVDHSAVEGERKKGSRLRESSIAVLRASCAEYALSPRTRGPRSVRLMIFNVSIPAASFLVILFSSDSHLLPLVTSMLSESTKDWEKLLAWLEEKHAGFETNLSLRDVPGMFAMVSELARRDKLKILPRCCSRFSGDRTSQGMRHP